MSILSLAPASTQNVVATAMKSLDVFLAGERVERIAAEAFVMADSTGDGFSWLMDKYAVYLAFDEGTRGAPLSGGSVVVYMSHVKNHFLNMCPRLEQLCARRLKKITSVLSKYCTTRGTDFVHQAPPCTKRDLDRMVGFLYKTATTPHDYSDAALLVLLWYMLGRSSDIESLIKSQISVSPSGCIYVNIKRRKTASVQGLSLFADAISIHTCPVHAVAVAMAMQTTPTKFVLDQLPRRLPQPHPSTLQTPRVDGRSPMQLYVGRLLKSVKGWEGVRVTTGMTSHSFRRGGTQHANADSKLATQWVLERGAWDITRLSKGFSYILNTSTQDEQVARTLAGRTHDAPAGMPTLDALDGLAVEKLELLQAHLFGASIGVGEECILTKDAIDVFTGSLVQYYPAMLAIRPDTPYVSRIQEAMRTAGITETDMQGWALTIADNASSPPIVGPPRRCVRDDLLNGKNQEILALRSKVAELEGLLQDLRD